MLETLRCGYLSCASQIDSEGPEGEEDPEDGKGDTCRVLKTHGDKCMVHWWFHPDSYDEWIPAADVEGDSPASDSQLQESAVSFRSLMPAQSE